MHCFQGLGLIPVPLMTAVLFFGFEIAGPPMVAGPEPRLGAGLTGGAARKGEAPVPHIFNGLTAAIPSFKASAGFFKTGG
jgi:hypothetical protein